MAGSARRGSASGRSPRGSASRAISRPAQRWDGASRSCRRAIEAAIPWSTLPRVVSNELFQTIKDYLVAEKEAGHLLTPTDELYRSFLTANTDLLDTDTLRAQFDTCIGRVENRGLIRRLKFGNLVLLQPELLDAYASALVNAAKDEPDGLGCISERIAQDRAFRIPDDERIKDEGQEKLLLIATIEDLLRHEISLREQTHEGPYLVFPSQFTRDWEDASPDPPEPGSHVLLRGSGAQRLCDAGCEALAQRPVPPQADVEECRRLSSGCRGRLRHLPPAVR